MILFSSSCYKKSVVKGILFVGSSILLCGCNTNPSALPSDTVLPNSFSREETRVTLGIYIDTPFTSSSPTKPIGYGGMWGTNFLRTAKHLVEDQVSRMVITNSRGIVCPVQNIWLHPYEDIALIKTSLPCSSGRLPKTVFEQPLPEKLLYIDNTLKTASLLTDTTNKVLIDKTLSPGMSGSPLFLPDHTLVGIVSAQQPGGTEFIAITPALLASRPEASKVLTQE